MGLEWNQAQQYCRHLLANYISHGDDCGAVGAIHEGQRDRSVGENLPQWRFLHSNPDHRRAKPATNRPGYGTAASLFLSTFHFSFHFTVFIYLQLIIFIIE
jgi:hypothetical protein